jgi:hypothetical protein
MCRGWQGCKEWLLLLTACEGRRKNTSEYSAAKAVRPVVRLVADPAVQLA